MELQNSKVIVAGGSHGLGLGVVEALAARGAQVCVVARNRQRLEEVAARLPVRTMSADVTDAPQAHALLSEFGPDAIVFAAGAIPPMGAINAISWEDFSATWQTDARGALTWIQAALNLPLRKGARFLTISSGAAIGGSPMSGGYAGAKRMQWLMTNYAAAFAEQNGLQIQFQTLVPGQMIAGGAVGDAGAKGYAAKMGMTVAKYFERFGKPLSPADFGEAVARLLSDPSLESGRTFKITGNEGLCVLEPAPT
jgi:NAD(P)-dependent dehydrogenase (short-subunit alcohol dehydrogenase family)